MWQYALRRLVYAVPILLGVSVVVFALITMAPGDAADMLIPPETPKEVALQIRSRLGLDQPIHVQYDAVVSRMLRGDLGISIVTNERSPPAPERARQHAPAGHPGRRARLHLGTLLAPRRVSPRDFLDRFFSATAITGVSLPHYWVGIVLVAIFAVTFNALPAQGMGPEGFPHTGSRSSTSSCPCSPSLDPHGRGEPAGARQRADHQPEFVGLLRQGPARPGVIARDEERRALGDGPDGPQLGYLLGGSILVETVFNWPGSGGLMNLAIFRRDVPVLSATILAIATLFVLINIAVDVLQAAVDPRIRR
jgi:peptide/nickel transport system permease protein